MSHGDGATTPENPRVGVVAPDSPSAIVAAVETVGGTIETGSAASVVAADPDLVVAVGDAAMAGLARAGVAVPVLAVGVTGVASVERPAATGVIERLIAGGFETRSRPVLGVSTPEHDARALADAVLVSAEPATISAFSVAIKRTVSHDHEDASPSDSRAQRDPDVADSRIERFRADGVAVATPAGSSGYARAAGGPTLAPGTGVVSVVPIAPFALDPGHWVCRPRGLSITIERDETAVELRADDRTVGIVEPGTPVAFGVAGSVSIVASEW